MSKKIIKVENLSRIEGEGGITVEISDGKVETVHVNVYEAPRFFEAFLRGRSYQDVIDFTARICGICPVAYQMSAVHAIERIMGIEIEEGIRLLRRLLYCGEWIASHSLHVYFLEGPDFYNFESAWSDRRYNPYLKRGLDFKKLGNEIIAIIGGRSIHPVSVKPGGFFSLPDEKALRALIPYLERAYEESLDGIRWSAGLYYDMDVRVGNLISLRHPVEYPMNEGRVISSDGLDVGMDAFMDYLQEYQVQHSTALHSGFRTDSSIIPYLVGPLARLNLNHDRLPSDIRSTIKECGITLPLENIKMGIVARSIEIAYSFYEAMRIIKNYETPEKPFKDYEPRRGSATWITEAPRGMLIHRYSLDEGGNIIECRLIPPTSQNLSHMEYTLRDFVNRNIQKPVDLLKKGCERLIRSYDSCISCSVHLVRI